MGALTGAGTGAAIGSAFTPLGTAIGAGVGGLVGAVGGFLGSDDDEDERRRQQEAEIARQQELERQMAAERERKRTTSLNLLGQMQGPSQSDAQKRRIAALEEESQAGPLSQDALFQGDRATLVSGGQQALSGVQNVQKAAGTSGGFSNQGSIQDVYDRLGVGLAGLGQQSRQVKEQKRDTAATLQQSFLDAQTSFANAQTNAKIAIEQGDADLAAEYLQQAYQARQAIEKSYMAAQQAAEQRSAAQQAAAIGSAGTMAGAALGGMNRAQAAPVGATPQALADNGSGYFNQEYQMPTYADLRKRNS